MFQMNMEFARIAAGPFRGFAVFLEPFQIHLPDEDLWPVPYVAGRDIKRILENYARQA